MIQTYDRGVAVHCLITWLQCQLLSKEGLEPPTQCLEGICSIHLNYLDIIGVTGFEPA